jgi:hypothetical protein
MKLNELISFHGDDGRPAFTDGYHLKRKGTYAVEVRLDGKPVRLFLNTDSYSASWIDACKYVNQKEGK